MTISFREAAETVVEVQARLLEVRGWTMGLGRGGVCFPDMDGAVLVGEDGHDPFGGDGNVIVANIFGNPGDSGGIFFLGTANVVSTSIFVSRRDDLPGERGEPLSLNEGDERGRTRGSSRAELVKDKLRRDTSSWSTMTSGRAVCICRGWARCSITRLLRNPNCSKEAPGSFSNPLSTVFNMALNSWSVLTRFEKALVWRSSLGALGIRSGSWLAGESAGRCAALAAAVETPLSVVVTTAVFEELLSGQAPRLAGGDPGK
jgi:hypothetical protein